MLKYKKALFIADSELHINSWPLQHAVNFASYHNTQLDIICILPTLAGSHYSNSNDTLATIQSTVIDNLTKSLQAVISEAKLAIKSDIKVVFGRQFAVVESEVLSKHYDIVIKQAENPSWLASLCGSDDLQLLRKCPCQLWLIDTLLEKPYQQVAVALDFSDDAMEQAFNEKIVQSAATFSLQNKAKMHIITACDPAVVGFSSMWANDPTKLEQKFLMEDERRRRFSSSFVVQQLRKQNPEIDNNQLQIAEHVLIGHPQTVIPQKLKALNIDLLVMGTVGRAGLSGVLIGNTAESILLQLPCSMLALKPPDWS